MKAKLSLRSVLILVLRPPYTRDSASLRVPCALCLFLALCVAHPALCQIPQGFNYQAVARDASNNPITTPVGVRFTIQSDTLGGTVFWVEEHLNVDPNDFGMFTVVVGKGDRISGLARFSDIDWKVTPKFIMTEINAGTWKLTGSSRLWTVPYAMVASGLEGSVTKLEVMGEDETSDEALFEVKRKDGKTMFAVYNHGVRVYMPLDTLSKTRKGGFAVSGFSDTKEDVIQDYLVVNPDSIRAYIDTNPGKVLKGGFAVAGFGDTKLSGEEYLRVTRDSTRIYLNDTGTKPVKGGFAVSSYNFTKGGIQDYFTVSPDSVRIYINDTTSTKTIKGGFAVSGFADTKGSSDYFNVSGKAESDIITGEPKVMWYPRKEAFLAGNVLVESDDSVGVNSWASGYRSKAIGDWSQALGYQAVARGDYSTAIGKNAIAEKVNSFAFGDGVNATGVNSYAFGRGARASSDGSYAFGFNATASGQDALAFGTGTLASGVGSFALGFIGRDSVGLATSNTKATGDWSFAIGMGSQSLNRGAITLGTLCDANGQFSFATGYESIAEGDFSIALGSNSFASGENAVAIGILARATASSAVALGHGEASGGGSTAINYGHSTNLASFAANTSTASGRYSTSTGYGNYANGDASINLGGAGSIAGGYCSATFGYITRARGYYSASLGFGSSSSGHMSVATGNYSISRSYATLVAGRYNDTTNMLNPTSWVATDPVFVVGNGTSNTDRKNAFTILKNGNVGINLKNPYYNLVVVGNLSNSSLLVSPNQDDQSLGNSEIILAEDYYANYRMKIQYNGADNKLHILGGYASTDYGPHLTILRNNGFTGIGNPNPTTRLHVQGTTKSVTTSGTDAAAGQFQSWTEGTAQGQRAVYSFYPTFQGTADNGPRRAADITSGFNGGAWGTEFLSFNVGLSGSANDGQNITTERMRIAGNGNVGIGTSAPGYKLHILTNAAAYAMNVVNDGNSYTRHGINIQCGADAPVTLTTHLVGFSDGDGTAIGSIYMYNGLIYYGGTSDSTLKRNIIPTKVEGIDLVNRFRVVDFELKQAPGIVHTGFIAQELNEVFPDAVLPGEDYLQISQQTLIPVLTKAIQEQQQIIMASTRENTRLRSELESLKERMAQIEAVLLTGSTK